MAKKMIQLPSGKEIEAGMLKKRLDAAGKEIEAICKKYDVRLQGVVQFFTPEIQVVPRVEEKDVV